MKISITTKQINALKTIYPLGRVGLLLDQGQEGGPIKMIKCFSIDGYNNGLHFTNDEIEGLQQEHVTSTDYPTKKHLFTNEEKKALSILKKVCTFEIVKHSGIDDALCEAAFFEREDLYAIKTRCGKNKFVGFFESDKDFHVINEEG